MQYQSKNRVGGRLNDVRAVFLIRLCGILIAAVTALAFAHTAFAATLPVTTTLDTGAGSLRNRIVTSAPGDTIVFSVTGVITLTNGQIGITKNITISGPGSYLLAVSGNNAGGVFSITAGAAVLINGLTIADGSNTASGGGGIENHGILTMTRVTLKNSSSTVGGGGIYNYAGASLTSNLSNFTSNTAVNSSGGGLENFGAASVTDCTYIGNTASLTGGAIMNSGTLSVTACSLISNVSIASSGGGIFNNGTLTVTDSIVESNTATVNFGGGLINFGTVTVNISTFAGNSASGGGGIENILGHRMTVNGSTFVSNTATQSGGGIANLGTLTLTASTLTGNSAPIGGGIINSGTMSMTFSTVMSNTAVSGGGGIYISGTLRLMDSIVAGSAGVSNCAGPGNVVSDGHNLSSDATCAITAAGDLSNKNPLLGPLHYNGGHTETMLPLKGSPAIDTGGDACQAPDQRGYFRPQGVHCDIGAVEVTGHFVYMPIMHR